MALLIGFAVQALGSTGEAALRGVAVFQKIVFKVLAMIMWVAPIGAFGAIAGVVAETGLDSLKNLALLMVAFYITCAVFVFGVLGTLLRVVTGSQRVHAPALPGPRVPAHRLDVLLGDRAAAPHRQDGAPGRRPPVVGIVVPTGYSFNLDGTAIYLTMASLFIAEATGTPLSLGEQISLLVFMIIASKGAAGVTGAGLATLAGGLQSHRPDLVDGVGIIVGIDRFMSEARAVTNFAGNAIATVLVGTWVKEIDRDRCDRVLAGELPFDERTMVDDDLTPGGPRESSGPRELEPTGAH